MVADGNVGFGMAVEREKSVSRSEDKGEGMPSSGESEVSIVSSREVYASGKSSSGRTEDAVVMLSWDIECFPDKASCMKRVCACFICEEKESCCL